MTEESVPAAPAPPAAPEPLPSRPPAEEPKSGCLKWGLIGCGGASALLIVGLVFIGTKAPDFLEGLLTLHERQVLAATTPEVTSEDRRAFEEAYRGFVARAKAGKAPISQIRDVSTKVTDALSDRRVTPEELRALTAAASAGGEAAPGKP